MKFVPPSKKIQVLIVVVVAILLAVIFLRSNFSLKSLFPSKQTSDLQLVAGGATDTSSLDSDNDGLKDWQEALWRTDPNNPDTDGDGTSDGQEVAMGRDPLVKGPNDSLDKTRGVATSSLGAFSKTSSDDQSNVSTQLSQNLFAQFMTAQQNGDISADTQNQIIATTIASVDPGTIPPKYTINDLKIVDENPTTLRNFGNTFAQILSDNMSKIDGQPNDVALASYQNMINQLVKVSVPRPLTTTDLQILNDFNVSVQSLSILIHDEQTDPVKALLAIKTFQNNLQDTKKLFTAVQSEMQKNGIIFSKTEPGSIWNTQ